MVFNHFRAADLKTFAVAVDRDPDSGSETVNITWQTTGENTIRDPQLPVADGIGL